jgi:4-hydroxy-tetrahydrodipicolinate reductase
MGRVVAVDRAMPADALPGNVLVLQQLDDLFNLTSEGVAIDVSLAEGAAVRVRAIARAGWPLVEGTTGLDAEADAALLEASRKVAVVRAPNFSPGAALLRRALAAVLAARGPTWDAAILDRHHRAKQDAPSGTAKLLAETIRAATGVAPQIASFRQGGVVGEHVVHLSAGDEELAFAHRAFSRGAFARGAVLAAGFAREARPGLYGMDDVLGLTG